ncbi:MAG: hypothetical protein Fur0034_03770 [Desulfuromonadia bacterium]
MTPPGEPNAANGTLERYLGRLGDLPIPFIITERETGLVIEVNTPYLDFFGFRRDEVIGRRTTDLDVWVDPHDRERFVDSFSRQGTLTGFESRFRLRGGRIVTLIVSSRRFTSAGCDYLLSTFTDVTERYRLEQKLRASESRYRSIFENRHTVMLIIDPADGSIVDANPAACRFYGYDRSTLQTMTISEINTLTPEEVAAEMGRARGGERNHFVFPHRLASGEIRQVEVYSGPITIEGKELLYSIITDITEKLKAEESIRRARDAAEEASRVKSRFLATVSHEIRTPLNAIIGFAALALDDPKASVCHDYFHHIRTASTTLLAIVNDILDFARLESGRISIKKSIFSPAEVIADVARTAQGWLAGDDVVIQISPNESLPLLVGGDETRLRQILLNLMNNAVKFTPRGMIRLTAQRLDGGGEDRVTLLFEVHDTGVGIPPDRIGELFSPFVQLERGMGRQGGAGLGLSICKSLCDLLGGTISLVSTPGIGTTCRVILPFEAAARPAVPDDGGEEAPVPPPSSLEGRRILLAEDNQVNQLVMTEALKRRGARVLIASTGEEALRIATEQPDGIDLILMDIEMPVMGGIEATIRLRSDPRTARIPIVALTAHAFDEQYRRCWKAGMNGCITKPVDIPRLLQLLAPYLSRGGGESTPVVSGAPLSVRGIDWPDLMRRFDRNVELCLVVLRSFVENKGSFAKTMGDALARGDWERCALEAHSLKGVTANLSATRLNRLALMIEEKIRDRDPDSLHLLLDEYEREFAIIAGDISRYAQGTDSSDPF